MANNFLRYKYYLITRASAEELYTAVKDIFASVEMKSKPKLDNAVKTALKVDMEQNTKLIASLADMLKSCVKIVGENELHSDISLDDTIHGNSEIGGINNLKAELTQYAAVNTASELTADETLRMVAKVMRQVFYPKIDEELTLGVGIGSKLDNAVKTALKIGDISFVETMKAISADSLLSSVKGVSNITQKTTATSATPIKPKATIGVLLSASSFLKLLSAVETVVKSVSNCYLRAIPSLFRPTILADYDDSNLADMDGYSLSVLDLIEII